MKLAGKVIVATLLLAGAVQALVAVAFFVQWPPIVGLWPYPGTTPLTFIFVASILAAAAAAQIWAAASENHGALAGIGLDYLVIFSALTVIFLAPSEATSGTPVVYLVLAPLMAAFGLALFVWSFQIPLDPTPPQPALVRWSFAVFVVGLVVVGGLVIAGVPNVIPWSITPELAVLVGWLFIGAAVFFAYGLWRPSWLNSAGQLLGFLAYDLVLIVPFFTRLTTSPPELLPSLVIYIAVVICSGLLAIYYLFVHAPTRARTWSRLGRATR